MSVGVIAEFESEIEPHVEGCDALVNLPEFVELPFVDESDDGSLLIAKSGQQFRRHLCDGGCIQPWRSGGQVVNRDRDLAIRGVLRR